MDPSSLPLFDLAERRLAWTDHRQEVLAQNIANANTPKWQAKDVRPFAAAMDNASGVTLARTAAGHLAGTQDSGAQSLLTTAVGVHAPDGNAVTLDEQLTKVADTATQQEIATTLYKKYLGMFSLALGYGAG